MFYSQQGFFPNLFQQAPIPYFVLDTEGKIIDLNEYAEKLTGYKKEELQGKNLFQLPIFNQQDIFKTKNILSKSKKGFSTGPEEYTIYYQDKSEIGVNISTVPLKIKEKVLVLVIISDISVHIDYRQKIEHLNQVLRAIRNVNQLIVKEDNPQNLIQKTGQILTQFRDYSDVWIVLLDKEQNYLTSAQAGFKNEDFSLMIEQYKKGNKPNCLKNILAQKELILISASPKICQDCPLFHYHKEKMIGGITLQYKNNVYGILSVSNPGPYLKNIEERELFQKVAQDLSLALYKIEMDGKRKQLEKALQEKSNKLALLLDITNTMTITHKIEDLFQKIVDNAVKLGGIDSAIIYTVENNSLHLKAAYPPLSENFLKKHRKTDLSENIHIYQAISTKQPIILTDIESAQLTMVEEEISKILHLKSLLYLPLFHKEKTIGILLMGSGDRLYPFSEEELAIYRILAGQISIAIEETRIVEENQNYLKALKKSIKEREKATKELQDRETLFSNIMSSMQDIVFTLDRRQRHTGLYGKWLQKWGLIPERFLGKTVREVLGGENARVHEEANTKALRGEFVLYEWSNQDEYGEHYFQTSLSPILDKNNKVKGLVGIGRDITELKRIHKRLDKTLEGVIELMVKVVERKDPYTAGHQKRVSQLAVGIAEELKLSPNIIDGIKFASLIHDIGKIALPSEILNKPSSLSEVEFKLVMSHPQIGYEIVKNIDFPYPLAEIILQHHERLDGSGYPNHLKDEEIIIEAKILGIADVVEAISSHRPYRPALGIDAALQEITKKRGILYEPKIVDACVKLLKKGFKFES